MWFQQDGVTAHTAAAVWWSCNLEGNAIRLITCRDLIIFRATWRKKITETSLWPSESWKTKSKSVPCCDQKSSKKVNGCQWKSQIFDGVNKRDRLDEVERDLLGRVIFKWIINEIAKRVLSSSENFVKIGSKIKIL